MVEKEDFEMEGLEFMVCLLCSRRGDKISGQLSALTHLSTLSFMCLHASTSQFLSEERLHYRSQRTRELDNLLGDLHCDIRGLLISLTKLSPDSVPGIC